MSSAARAVAQLNAAIKAIRGAGDPESYAPDVAEALREELEAQFARGEGPDGEKWKPIEESSTRVAGGPPLRNAAKALRVVAIGPRVVASIGGRYYYHHIGKTRGNVARPLLPSRKLSAPAERAVRKAMIRRFGELMKGAA
jgi:hypothetical protein